jgi:hypothetical protein
MATTTAPPPLATKPVFVFKMPVPAFSDIAKPANDVSLLRFPALEGLKEKG